MMILQISTIVVLFVGGYFVIGAAIALNHLLRADLDPNARDAFEEATGYFLFWLPMLIGTLAYRLAEWAAALASRARARRKKQPSAGSIQRRAV
jgi:hypothetical protein